MPLDKKICAGGIVMLLVGIIIILNQNISMPVGQSGMSDEDVLDLITKQQEHQDVNNLAGILIAFGFMLILISFGARRKRKGSPEKEVKKPIA